MSSNGRKSAQSSKPVAYRDAGYVVPIRLTARQLAYSRRALGISRFIYNLCVATHAFCRINRLQWPSWQDLNQAVNDTKRHDFPFLKAVSHRVTDGAIRDFGNALANWRNPDIKARRPAFKKKRLTSSGSFRAAGAKREIRYDGKRRIRLPHLGSVKLAHTLPQGIYHEARISLQNGQWLLSINYWKPPVERRIPDTRILAGGVDTGINPHATDSDAQTWENPKAYYVAERRLARWQRAQARRTVNSRGWWQAQHRIDRLHRRVNSLRNNATHQITSELVNKFQHLVIEDLHVAGLMQGSTPKAQADAGMGEIKRQLLYKGQWHHCNVLLAPRFYPSSKTCSNCGYVNAKLKRERYWQCPNCTTIHERNINAAVNLRSLIDQTLTPVASLRDTLRDGKALARQPAGETGPIDRRTAPLSTRATQTVIG